jgi:hypothetical protein
MGINACEDCFCGDCDSAGERDSWNPNAAAPMVIRVRFILIATTNEDLPSPTQVNNQLSELNDAFEDYGIQFERGDADTFDVDARYGHFLRDRRRSAAGLLVPRLRFGLPESFGPSRSRGASTER